MTPRPDIEVYREFLRYEDGKLYWQKRPGAKCPVGKQAGTKSNAKMPYRRLKFLGHTCYEHQIVFALHHGYWPEMIDHVDRNKTNNRIENLRESDFVKNGNNRGATRVSKTGVKGVFPSGNKFFVKRVIKGKQVYGGTFDTIEEAEAASKALS